MILADTNVLSALLRAADRAVVEPRLDRQSRGSAWIGTVAAAALRRGVTILPPGRRRDVLGAWCERTLARFAEEGRITPFDLAATRHFAAGKAGARATGRKVQSFAGAAIAATALDRRFAVATRDTGPFEAMGCEVIDLLAVRRG
jgi:predicted nucleic acid-binding protein